MSATANDSSPNDHGPETKISACTQGGAGSSPPSEPQKVETLNDTGGHSSEILGPLTLRVTETDTNVSGEGKEDILDSPPEVQEVQEVLPISEARLELSREVDVWLTFISEHEDWQHDLYRELSNDEFIIKQVGGNKSQETFKTFSTNTIRVVDMLGVVSGYIIRVYPDSHCSHSTQAVQEVMLSLLHKLQPEDIWKPKSIFFRDIFLRMNSSRRTMKLKLDNDQEIPPSLLPDDYLNLPTDRLLEVLLKGLVTLSNDFKLFSDRMNVQKNSEMDFIQDSLFMSSVFIKHCAKSTTIYGRNMCPIYTTELMQQLDKHLVTLANDLDKLIKQGLPEFEDDFRDQEKRSQAESLALLSVATFFSVITASTLIISVEKTSTLYRVVNFFWFTSLVLSITSVMNSLLAFTWKQAVFRKRFNYEQLPRAIALWSRESPLYFLVAAALSFIVGLCLLSFASSQPRWTSAITTLLTGFSIIGLAWATTWFIREHYAYRRATEMIADSSLGMDSTVTIVKSDTLIVIFFDFVRTTSSKWLEKGRRSLWNLFCFWRGPPRPVSVFQIPGSEDKGETIEGNLEELRILGSSGGVEGNNREEEREEERPSDYQTQAYGFPKYPLASPISQSGAISFPASVQTTNALLSIAPKELELKREDHNSWYQDELCLSFSLDGKLLGVTEPRAISLWRMSDQSLMQRLDSRPNDGAFAGGIEWSRSTSPDAKKSFIVPTSSGIQVWQEDEAGQFQRVGDVNIHLERSSKYEMFEDGLSFWIITGSRIFRFGPDGANKYAQIWEGSLIDDAKDIDSTANVDKVEYRVHDAHFINYNEQKSRFVISVTTTVSSRSMSSMALKTSRQFELIVHNYEDKKVESLIPLFDCARTLWISKDKNQLLVGYVTNPAQLWNIYGVEHGVLTMLPSQVFRYLDRKSTPSEIDGDYPQRWADVFFFGAEDEFVGRWVYGWQKHGPGVLVWERVTGMYLCTIPFKEVYGGTLPAIAIDHSHPSLMSATAGVQGINQVSLWTCVKERELLVLKAAEETEIPEGTRRSFESAARKRAWLSTRDRQHSF